MYQVANREDSGTCFCVVNATFPILTRWNLQDFALHLLPNLRACPCRNADWSYWLISLFNLCGWKWAVLLDFVFPLSIIHPTSSWCDFNLGRQSKSHLIVTVQSCRVFLHFKDLSYLIKILNLYCSMIPILWWPIPEVTKLKKLLAIAHFMLAIPRRSKKFSRSANTLFQLCFL